MSNKNKFKHQAKEDILKNQRTERKDVQCLRKNGVPSIISYKDRTA